MKHVLVVRVEARLAKRFIRIAAGSPFGSVNKMLLEFVRAVVKSKAKTSRPEEEGAEDVDGD